LNWVFAANWSYCSHKNQQQQQQKLGSTIQKFQ
jgi:hypothetical protein